MIRTGIFVAMLMVTAPAGAEMNFAKMQIASGLVEIISKAEACGYTVDEGALESYYVEQDLANPETLSFISNSLSVAEMGDPPSSTDCTMARVTGQSIGVLAGP